MSWLFGKKSAPAGPPPPPPPPPPSLDEEIRRNKRQIDKSCRELDRERQKLEANERKVKIEMKKLARENQVDAARILAKDLARTRGQISKMYQMKTQMQSVSMQMSAMKTQQAMGAAMGNVVTMMAKMNAQMDLPAMQQMLMQYEVEHGKMEITSEIMDDALDGVGAEDEHEEADRLLQEVLVEAGMEQTAQIGGAHVPMGMPGAAPAVANADTSEIDARLDKLNK